jgi:hypothetical protein
MAEDIDDVIKWVRSQGWRVERDQRGYRHFYTPEGAHVVRYPATPGNKRRRLDAVITAIRRHGIVWPKPSKKEQRSFQGKGDAS